MAPTGLLDLVTRQGLPVCGRDSSGPHEVPRRSSSNVRNDTNANADKTGVCAARPLGASLADLLRHRRRRCFEKAPPPYQSIGVDPDHPAPSDASPKQKTPLSTGPAIRVAPTTSSQRPVAIPRKRISRMSRISMENEEFSPSSRSQSPPAERVPSRPPNKISAFLQASANKNVKPYLAKSNSRDSSHDGSTQRSSHESRGMRRLHYEMVQQNGVVIDKTRGDFVHRSTRAPPRPVAFDVISWSSQIKDDGDDYLNESDSETEQVNSGLNLAKNLANGGPGLQWMSNGPPEQWVVCDIGHSFAVVGLELVLAGTKNDPKVITVLCSDTVHGPWDSVKSCHIKAGPQHRICREGRDIRAQVRVRTALGCHTRPGRYWKLLVDQTWGAEKVCICSPLKLFVAWHELDKAREEEETRTAKNALCPVVRPILPFATLYTQDLELSAEDVMIREMAKRRDIRLPFAERLFDKWKKYDKGSGDNGLDFQDFGRLLTDVINEGKPLPNDRVQHFFGQVDTGRSNSIFFEEFLVWFHEHFYKTGDFAGSEFRFKKEQTLKGAAGMTIEKFYTSFGTDRVRDIVSRRQDAEIRQEDKEKMQLLSAFSAAVVKRKSSRVAVPLASETHAIPESAIIVSMRDHLASIMASKVARASSCNLGSSASVRGSARQSFARRRSRESDGRLSNEERAKATTAKQLSIKTEKPPDVIRPTSALKRVTTFRVTPDVIRATSSPDAFFSRRARYSTFS